MRSNFEGSLFMVNWREKNPRWTKAPELADGMIRDAAAAAVGGPKMDQLGNI